MLHVHVLFVAPLGAGHMAQSGTDQHEGGVSVRETEAVSNYVQTL